MPRWLTTLDLVDIWGQFDREEITPPQVATQVADRLAGLSGLPASAIQARDNLVEELRDMADDTDADIDDFDRILERLYNWADSPPPGPRTASRLCWVKPS